MTQRIQKARSREEFEREERLASQTLGGSGNKGDLGTNAGAAGGQRNVAPGAQNPEQQDYDEENRTMLGGTEETGDTETIQAGTYEEDYGVGVEGRREAGQVGEKKEPQKDVLRRNERTVGGDKEHQEDFPTGKWSRQKSRAKLARTPRSAKVMKEESQRLGSGRAKLSRGGRKPQRGVRGKGVGVRRNKAASTPATSRRKTTRRKGG